MKFNNESEEIEYLKSEIFKGNTDVFYKSGMWRRKREEILERDHFECQKCKLKKHRLSKANTVHHIVHLRDNPDLMLSNKNLISLCERCHNEEHPEKRFKSKKKRFVNEEMW